MLGSNLGMLDIGILTTRLDLIHVSILCYETMRSKEGIFLSNMAFFPHERKTCVPSLHISRSITPLALLSRSSHYKIPAVSFKLTNIQTHTHTCSAHAPHTNRCTPISAHHTHAQNDFPGKEDYAFYGVV